MDISEFKGIIQYHDGRPVSDYCNLIPLGNSIIDRLGERAESIYPLHNDRVLETFVDSLGNVYVAHQTCVLRYTLRDDNTVFGHGIILDASKGYNPQDTVTFTESSTKPSQVYVCDGANVWYWNTVAPDATADMIDGNYTDRYEAYKAVQLPLFKNPDTLRIDGIPLAAVLAVTGKNETGTYVGWWPDVSRCTGGEPIVIHNITWFDNRLVLVEKQKNTVWLSAVDPSRWLTPSQSSSQSTCKYPMFPWQMNYDQIENTFITSYYASTASSANIMEAVAFAGQLYFLNDTSIEVWSATGNDDNPIQHNSQNTLYYGARSPLIINDTLYLICKGAINNEFIAAINQAGAITPISNNEIEQRIMPHAFRLRPLSVRDQSMIIVYVNEDYTNGYAITKSGYWWRYWNGNHEAIAWSVTNRAGEPLGISKYGTFATATEHSRKYIDGAPISRTLRGAWAQFIGRRIIRAIEVVCDTGIYMSPASERAKLFLRVSFDRGSNFGPFLYRALGNTQNNNRVMIWRNCGSGNSMLIEFGTSDEIRFQLYGLRIEID